MHAEVLVGLSEEKRSPHRRQVDFVDNRVDGDSGTIRLRAVFANADGALVPGLFARLRLPTGKPRPTVLIDPRAIGTDLGHRFVRSEERRVGKECRSRALSYDRHTPESGLRQRL